MISKLLGRLMLAMLPLVALAAPGDGKPVEWVVGYAPGGGSDVVARMLAEAMGFKVSKQTFSAEPQGRHEADAPAGRSRRRTPACAAPDVAVRG